MVLATVAVTLLLWARPAQAQSRGGCGRGGSSGGQQSSLRTGSPQQQYAMLVLRQQQQNALLAQLQQQQQNALLAQQLRQQQQQNALVAQQRNAAADPLRAVEMPERRQPGEQSDNPEETATRQLKIARLLASDADTAQQKGERILAARLRGRAGERLQDVVAKYGGTKAADAAQELLQELHR
jgi:hypothetical protein